MKKAAELRNDTMASRLKILQFVVEKLESPIAKAIQNGEFSAIISEMPCDKQHWHWVSKALHDTYDFDIQLNDDRNSQTIVISWEGQRETGLGKDNISFTGGETLGGRGR